MRASHKSQANATISASRQQSSHLSARKLEAAMRPLTMLLLMVQLVSCQCPWARDSSELHSDCICDFNPQAAQRSQSSASDSTLSPATVVRRMSVQCAPVDFEKLLRALKQTASIELPWQLAQQTFNSTSSEQLNRTKDTQAGGDAEDLEEARMRLISQAKLDLLHVSNSSIGRLENNTFILDTQRGPLESISSRHLVVAIQALHLSRCGIRSIESGAFNGLEWSLTSLSLNDNLLELVPSDAIGRLVNLKLLDLSNNRIKFIRAGAFLNLNKLNTLRLADNKQIGRQLGQSRQSGDPDSQTLAPNESGLAPATQSSGIDLDAFEGLEESLIDLSLKNNQLSEFPRSISKLKILAFLNLAQNQIARVPALMFSQMSALTAINLERNRISSIEGDTFRGVEQTLSSLSLLGNLIESFPVKQLEQLKALRRLDLGYNQIDSLPANAFAANKKLILIALDGNPLETLPEEAFKPLEGVLRGLSVGGKTLNCDCRLSWMLQWQLEHSLQISSREHSPQFCSKPNYLRSLVSFAALKPEHLSCDQTAQQSVNSVAPAAEQAATKAKLSGTAIFRSTSASLAGNGGWSVSGLGPNELAYFTLAESQPPETTTTTTTTTASSTKTTEEPSPETISTGTSAPDIPTTRVTDTSAASESHETSASSSESSMIASATKADEDLDEETASGQTDGILSEASTLATEQRDNHMLAGLPDDELFVDPHDTAASSAGSSNRHKMSRQGYLAANDLMRFNKTSFSNSVLIGQHQRRTLEASSLSSSEPKRVRQHHYRHEINAAAIPNSLKPPQIEPIQSVFGDRQLVAASVVATTNHSAEATSQSVATSPSIAVGQRSNSLHARGQHQQQVPAVPTTINVYKTPPSNSIQTNFAERLQPVQFKTQIEQALMKGARFMDELPTTTPAAILSSKRRVFAPKRISTTTKMPELSEPDIERFSLPAASDVRLTTYAHPLLTTSNILITSPAVPQTITSTTSTSTTTSTTTPEPTLPPSSLNQTQFNTRMSVSSMYRLATSEAPKMSTSASLRHSGLPLTILASSTTTTTTTTSLPPPTIVSHVAPIEQSGQRTNKPDLPVDSSTRMSATVRVVDSLTQMRIMTPSTHSPSTASRDGATSSTTTTTSSPTRNTSTSSTTTTSTTPAPRTTIAEASQTTLSSTSPSSTSSASLSSSTNNLINQPNQEGQFNDESNHRTTLPATMTEISHNHHTSQTMNQASKPLQIPANLITKETSSSANNRRHSLSSEFLDTSSRLLVKRFPKLANVDQVALVLAGFMCILTFLIALLAIICTCCSLRKRSVKPMRPVDSSQSSSPTNLSSTLTRANQVGEQNCFMRLLCCCFTARSSVTPIQALIMNQEDDNSTASSSGADGSSSSSRNANGKTMLLSSVHLERRDMQAGRRARKPKFYTMNNRRSLGNNWDPLNHEASMKIHKQAHELERSSHGGVCYFLGMSKNQERLSNRHRRSKWASEIDFGYEATKSARKCTIDGNGWISDSCDSDKSCSPGANKNNRYNIGDAHKAYLAGKQIQATMFVTTQSGDPGPLAPGALGGRRASSGQRLGLLKTIESSPPQQISSGYMEYFGGCNLSDRSTDDSRAPLERSTPHHRDITNGMSTFHIDPSMPTSSKFPIVGRAAMAATSSFSGPQFKCNQDSQGRQSHAKGQHRIEQRIDFSASDLMPISAEEGWPEPYAEPKPPPPPVEDEIQLHSDVEHVIGQHYSNDPDSRRHHSSVGNQQSQDRHIEVDYIQQPQVLSEQLVTNRSYDEAYLANWRTIGRNPNQNRGHQHRPSIGGSNWLRWAPTDGGS